MSETNYHICLSVPLGKRNGTMLIQQSGSRINGWLDVMGQRNALSGVRLEDGHLELSGIIQSLMSTMPYTATGTINGQQIQLTLKTASGAYYLLSGEEFKPDDKVL